MHWGQVSGPLLDLPWASVCTLPGTGQDIRLNLPALCRALQVMRPSARELVLSALPAVDELRSTTARMALLFFQVCCTLLSGPCCSGHDWEAHDDIPSNVCLTSMRPG
jgi:hypothetical protein